MQTVYLETTIPSYLASRPSRDLVTAGHQEATREWWDSRRESFELFISPFVLDEMNQGDVLQVTKRNDLVAGMRILTIDEAVVELAMEILSTGLIPLKAATDASHIACATRHGMDFLLTWNCKHIANAEMLRIIEKVIRKNGYVMPYVCTPDELMGGQEYE